MSHCYNFMIDERPCAYCSLELDEDNRRFLRGIEPNFFLEPAEKLLEQVEEHESMVSATQLRLLYGHAMETFFALACATVQAPHFPLGWVLWYKNYELRSVVEKLRRDEVVYARIPRPLSWQALSQTVHAFTAKDEELDDWLKSGFASAWARFAPEFVSQGFTDETNSLKHGLRVAPGGFDLRLWGRGDAEEGKAPVIDSDSQYGSQYFVRKKLRKQRNVTGIRTARNWNPRALVKSLEVLSMSIHNVVQYLMLAAGTPWSEIRYEAPSGPSRAFEEPFNHGFLIREMSGGAVVNPEDIVPRTKQEIVDTYDDEYLGEDANGV